MNKLVKAALLTLVIASPVAAITPAVQAAPPSHTNVATSKSNKVYRKHHHHAHRYHNGASVKSNLKNK